MQVSRRQAQLGIELGYSNLQIEQFECGEIIVPMVAATIPIYRADADTVKIPLTSYTKGVH